MSLIIVASTLIFSGGCDNSSVQDTTDALSTYAQKCDESPVIDGILNDSCWKDALTVPLEVQGADEGMPTLVRASWDDSFLYFAFECRDKDAVATAIGRDSDLVGGDYITLLIDADSDSTTVAMIRIAPNGVFSDTYCLIDKKRDTVTELSEWNCDDLRVSVSVYGGDASAGTADRFWTAEIALPFSEFPTANTLIPLSGDHWLVGFGRADIMDNGHQRSYFGVDTVTYRQALSLLRFEGEK